MNTLVYMTRFAGGGNRNGKKRGNNAIKAFSIRSGRRQEKKEGGGNKGNGDLLPSGSGSISAKDFFLAFSLSSG